jgi:hypothetical protein
MVQISPKELGICKKSQVYNVQPVVLPPEEKQTNCMCEGVETHMDFSFDVSPSSIVGLV